MTPDAWTEYDGPRFEKLRHNRKYHGNGKPHNPEHGMVSGRRVGIREVVEWVTAEQRKARKQANRAKAMSDDMRAIAKRQRREAREQEAQG